VREIPADSNRISMSLFEKEKARTKMAGVGRSRRLPGSGHLRKERKDAKRLWQTVLTPSLRCKG